MKSGGPHDDFVRALLDKRTRPLDGAYAAADPAYRTRRQQLDQIVIRPAAESGVKIDHLNLRKCGELFEHDQRGVAFERLFAALDELHHLAVHQIDAGENHPLFLTGMPWRSSCSFRSDTV